MDLLKKITKRGFSLSILIVALSFALFWAKGAISLDPDFGFRLKTGELILAEGIPKTDPYSYTMPSFPYVEHSWLTAVSWVTLHPIIGKVGLSAIYSFIAVLAVAISYSRARRIKSIGNYQHFIFLLAVAVILPFVGVRAQVVTWLLSAILLKVIFDKSLWNKWRSFLPLFFILWVNLHGGFAAGLLILFFVVAIRSIRKKLIEKPDVYVVAASVVATLVNPYGLGAWAEVWRTFTDTALRWQISEWMPAFLTVDLPFAAFVTLSTILVIRYRHKFTLEETGLYFLILLQGVLSKRHIPLWVIVALPMIVSAVNLFYNEIKGIKGSIPRFKKAVKFAFIGSLILLIFQSAFSLRSARVLGEERFYPKGAVSYLEQNLPEGEVFSLYGWGGYLIWKLPEKKVFIDGRMPSWRWDKNPLTESSAAFDDYNNLLKGEKEYKQVFDKYGVDTVLWPRPAPKSVLEVWGDKIESLFAREEKVDFDFLKTIEREGWEKLYEDSVAAIYRKP